MARLEGAATLVAGVLLGEHVAVGEDDSDAVLGSVLKLIDGAAERVRRA